MGFPKDNQFWKVRSKHGRDKLFATSALLWKEACRYFEWCIENPWMKMEQVKQPGKGYRDDEGEYVPPTLLLEIPTARPFTMQGLCLFLNCDTSYFRKFKEQVLEKDHDFITIITRIEETVYQQKFEGAAVGAFNASIIARDLGLSEKSSIEVMQEQPLFSKPKT